MSNDKTAAAANGGVPAHEGDHNPQNIHPIGSAFGVPQPNIHPIGDASSATAPPPPPNIHPIGGDDSAE